MAGVTGLEPATSGLTGRSAHGASDPHGMASCGRIDAPARRCRDPRSLPDHPPISERCWYGCWYGGDLRILGRSRIDAEPGPDSSGRTARMRTRCTPHPSGPAGWRVVRFAANAETATTPSAGSSSNGSTAGTHSLTHVGGHGCSDNHPTSPPSGAVTAVFHMYWLMRIAGQFPWTSLGASGESEAGWGCPRRWGSGDPGRQSP